MKSIFKNPIGVSVIATVLGGLILKLIDLISGTSILSFVLDKVKSFFSLFAIRYEIPIWGIILIVLLSMVFIVILDVILNSSNKKKEDVDIFQPIFDKYREDYFDGILYRWEFNLNYRDKYEIENLAIHCANCKCYVRNRKCPNCNEYVRGRISEDSDIKTLIEYRIEKKMERLLKSPPSL